MYRVRRKIDGQSFAAKIFKINKNQMVFFERLGVEKELEILRSIKHPLIIGYVEEFFYNNRLCIVTELASDKDLEILIKERVR